MAKPDGVRVLRVSRQILEVLSRFVQARSGWELEGYITLTRVRMTKDLKNAKVGVRMVAFDTSKEPPHQLAVEALSRRAIEMQHYLAKELKLRFTPKLQFVVDEGWDEILKVENTLRELALQGKTSGPDQEETD